MSAVRGSGVAAGMAALGMDHMGTRNSSPGQTFKIHDVARAVRLFPLACPAPKAEHSRGMLVRRVRPLIAECRIHLGQNRRQRNWLAAGQAADATIRLLNSLEIHTKHLLRNSNCLTKGCR